MSRAAEGGSGRAVPMQPHEAGPTNGRRLSSTGRVGAGSEMLHERQSVRDDRHAQHLAAVRQSLGWADAAARAGDHADALHWLDVVEAVGSELSAECIAKREAWRPTLRGASAAEQPVT